MDTVLAYKIRSFIGPTELLGSQSIKHIAASSLKFSLNVKIKCEPHELMIEMLSLDVQAAAMHEMMAEDAALEKELEER